MLLAIVAGERPLDVVSERGGRLAPARLPPRAQRVDDLAEARVGLRAGVVASALLAVAAAAREREVGERVVAAVVARPDVLDGGGADRRAVGGDAERAAA